jgi:hypothetical protein
MQIANFELRLWFRSPKAEPAATTLEPVSVVTLPEDEVTNLLGIKQLPMEALRITKRAVVGIFIRR